MLILYIQPGCPYSARVLAAGDELGITFEKRDIIDPAFESELMARGGKLQTPYLIDAEKGVEMYESKAIIAHLHERFTKTPLS